MRRSGASGCWKPWIRWRRRSANWTGEWPKKPGSGRKRVRLMTHPGVGPVTALAMVVDVGTGGEIRLGQAGGKLFWPDSERSIQRRKTAVKQDQQTGQFVSALAGGSKADGGGRYDPQLKRFTNARGAQESQRRYVAVARKLATVVPDAARELDVRATLSGRHAGEPESFCGRRVTSRAPSGQPASLKCQGVRSA